MPRALGPLLLLLSLALPSASAQRTEHFLDSDGVRLRYLVQGSGTPVVLLHGFALSAEMNWIGPGIADTLANRFRVIALDLRGHGGSTKLHDSSAYSAAFLTDVLAVLDTLRIPRAHVVGYSMGGRIALSLAATHPDRVISAVLGGQGWQPPGTPLPPHVQNWLAQLDRLVRDSGNVADVFERPGGPPLPPALRAGLARNDPAALAAVLRGMQTLTVTQTDLAAGRVPILAVYGELDAGSGAAIAALKTVRPDVIVTVIPGADHAGAIPDPRLAAAIRAFLVGREPR